MAAICVDLDLVDLSDDDVFVSGPSSACVSGTLGAVLVRNIPPASGDDVVIVSANPVSLGARAAVIRGKRSARQRSGSAVAAEIQLSDDVVFIESSQEVLEVTTVRQAPKRRARAVINVDDPVVIDRGTREAKKYSAASVIVVDKPIGSQAVSQPVLSSKCVTSHAVDADAWADTTAAAVAEHNLGGECGICHRTLTLSATYCGGVVRLTDCGCSFCAACFATKAQNWITSLCLTPAMRPCPSTLGAAAAVVSSASTAAASGECKNGVGVCTGVVSDSNLRAALDKHWLDKLDVALLNHVLSTCDGMKQCPACKCWVEMIAAHPSSSASVYLRPQRDETGKAMTAAVIAHRDTYRLRCVCGVAWCTLCGSQPYHLGRTCEAAAAHAVARKCRFCDAEMVQRGAEVPAPVDASSRRSGRRKTVSKDVVVCEPPLAYETDDGACNARECRERAAAVCQLTLPCGHACVGIRDESRQPTSVGGGCPPCLVDNCAAAAAAPPPRSRRDDYCTLCYTEALGAAPCVRIGCGHMFHAHCVRSMLESKWSSARISFKCMSCPLCSVTIASHWALNTLLGPLRTLRNTIEGMAMHRLKIERLEHDSLIASRFQGDALAYAMQRFAYYPCAKCHKPYYGGMRACDVDAAAGPAGGAGAGNAVALQELICPACQVVPPGVTICQRHGKEALERKCRYCCTQAVWYCWGTTSFCDPCHAKQNSSSGWWMSNSNAKAPVCAGKESCPLQVAHPKHGEEFFLGCAECRIALLGQLG